MLSLRKAGAREAVEVSRALYAVHTDFRYWLRFSEVLRSGSPLLSDFDFMYARRIPEDRHAGLFALVDFYAGKRELPRAHGAADRAARD